MKSQQWFNKNGGVVVFFGRLIPGIRTFISILAGFEEMRLLAFLLYSIVGTSLWVGLLSYAGFVLGQNYQLVIKVPHSDCYCRGGGAGIRFGYLDYLSPPEETER